MVSNETTKQEVHANARARETIIKHSEIKSYKKMMRLDEKCSVNIDDKVIETCINRKLQNMKKTPEVSKVHYTCTC